MIEHYTPEGTRLCTPQNREILASPMGLERAMHHGTIVEGRVTLCDSRLRLHVDLGCAEGIVEPEDAVFCRGGEERKDIAIITRVGKPIAFRILSVENRDGKLFARLSRRLAQQSCINHYMSCLKAGDILPARVTHMEPFGAFLDVGCGVSSLLSVDCISVSRISHPKDRLSCGEELYVVVKSIDRESGRIYVSLRELLGTWEENAARFEAGQTVTGIVRSVESYGIFIELAPNLAGLAELREGCEKEAQERIGKSVAVYIKSIVPERMKIKLVMIDAESGGVAPSPPAYYVDPHTVKHLDRWIYSPPNARKLIETVFE